MTHLSTEPRRWVLLGLLLLGLMATGAWAASEPTEIFDTMILGRDVCTLTITGGDRYLCLGGTATVEAVLTCAEGYDLAADPQWFLDGTPAGIGTQVDVSPEAGSHILLVTCGSCEAQITVNVLSCTVQPDLDAAFSDDATEATSGIFMQPNISPVSPQNFAYLKYLMRPFTVVADTSVHVGTYTLSVTGDNVLALYRTNGQSVPLPAVFTPAELPLNLLANASGLGEAVVSATYVPFTGGPATSDDVRVRVGTFPGISGKTVAEFPWFHFVDSINDNSLVSGAVDPFRHSERLGLPYRAYVVPHKPPGAWAAQPSLADASGGFESGTVTAGSVQDNILDLWTSGLDAGNDVSKSYDIVYDFGLDGNLDPGDLIDGFANTGAGLYLVRDLTLPGPYVSTQVDYTGGTFLSQRLYYPTSIGSMGLLPLVVISHGNGHDYRWYDYLGQLLASHGYIVMSHTNNTVPGIETASTTTLTNTDYILGNLATIAGGALVGHLNNHKISWIGHSRGGEGVVRAYDRMVDGYAATNFATSDIILVSSIAPTVFLAASESNPHTVDYHLIVGGADGDVSGAPDCSICQYFRISDRALGTVQTTYIHGASHNDFNCCGGADGTGPNLIGRAEAQKLAKSYYLALLDWYTKGNLAGREYFTRMYDDLRPSGVLATDEVSTAYRELNTPANFVVDDFQTQTSTTVSSSGGAVTSDVSNLNEGALDDNNTSFTWTTTDPMNGMTFNSGSGDFTRGAVLDYTTGETRYIEFEVIPGQRDLRNYKYVSFRACQGTRHTETVALNGSNSFSVTLRDGNGASSTIHFGAWGKLDPLYQRTGFGTGAGWVNEMNTVRIGLSEFLADGSPLDLTNIVAVRLEFGSSYGSPRGRIGLDDVQFMRN
jgi:hypothetical protein